MITSPNHSPRTRDPVRLVVGHSAEGARDRFSLGRYFQGDVDASSHVGIDGGGIEPYVPYDRAAWTLLNGNPISDNAELCGFARWTREQWLSTGTVDGVVNPKAMVDNFAAWVRERCRARNIPIRKLTPAQVDAGEWGVIGHVDWSLSSIGQGDHTDPGPGFPWDYVITRASGGEVDEMADLNAQRVPVSGAPEGKYDEMADIALGAAVGNARTAVAKVSALTTKVDALAADVRELKSSGVPVDVKLSDEDVERVAERLAAKISKRLES